MIDLKAFRKVNSLTQIELAEFFGVGQGFISQIEKGDRPIPREYISKLLANHRNWDTTMLDEAQVSDWKPELIAGPKPSLSNVEILLRDMLAEKEAKIDALNEIIWELKAENARLAEQLRIKKGDAAGAEDSFSATA